MILLSEYLRTCGGMAAGAAILACPAAADEQGLTFSIDVAADCNRFQFSGPVRDTGNPDFGAFFIQEGVIYRAGTFAKYCPDGDGCGLEPDGTPEFPKAVIGKWTCWGSFVADGVDTKEGVWLYSTQLFEFDVEPLGENVNAPGETALVSHGPERVDEDVPFSRAVTGGYNRFKGALGEVIQTKIGFNQTECENFTFDFKLSRADVRGRPHDRSPHPTR